MDNIVIKVLFFGVIAIAILAVIVESVARAIKKNKEPARLPRFASPIIGAIASIVSAMHGYSEILHRATSLKGLMFEADTARSLIDVPSSDWKGWVALSIVPDFLITGILAIALSLAIFAWSVFFMGRKNAGLILILLSAMIIPFGGGFIPPFFGVIAGIIGLRIRHKGKSIA